MSFELAFKVGNVFTKDAHLGALDLMPIDIHDTPIKSKNTKSIFGVTTLGDSLRPYVVDAIESLNAPLIDGQKPGFDYRLKKKYINWPYLLQKIGGSSTLRKNLETPGLEVPSIDLTMVTDPTKLFKDAYEIDPSKAIRDFNAISSGDHTVGPGKDYETHALAAADTTTLTDLIRFLMDATTTETGAATWGGDADGNAILFINNSPSGSPILGHQLNLNHAVRGIDISMSNLASNYGVAGYSIYRSQNAGVNAAIYMTSTGTPLVTNLFIDGRGNSGEGLRFTAGAAGRVCNFIIWDIGASRSLFLNVNGTHAENGLVYNGGADGVDGGTADSGIIKSVASFGNVVDFADIGGKTLSNTASEDGTSPDNPSLTPSEQMELNKALANFGLPKIGGLCDDGGIAPTYCITDLNGVAYGDYADNRPIGPKILVPAVSGVQLGPFAARPFRIAPFQPGAWR